MKDILGLTTFDNIRAVLAVSPSDLPDVAMTSYALEDDLSEDLLSWFEDWESVVEDSREQRLLRLYAKYRCAAWVAIAGQNFMLKKYSDGANEGQRSDTEGYQALQERIAERAEAYKSILSTAVEPDPVESSTVSMFGVSKPSRDPVVEGRNSVSG